MARVLEWLVEVGGRLLENTGGHQVAARGPLQDEEMAHDVHDVLEETDFAAGQGSDEGEERIQDV
jgi:hypothetical protein